MSFTTQRHALPAGITILDSLDTLAHLPAWLECAADSARVTDALRRNIPECAAGTLVLYTCRSKHLRLAPDGTGWSGTYHCTIADPATNQQQSVALLGVLFAPHVALPDAAQTPAPFAAATWQLVIPALRLAFQVQPPETQLDAFAALTDPEHARMLLEQSMEHSALRPQIASCQPEVLRYHPGLRCTIGYYLTYQDTDSSRQSWPSFVVAKTYEDERGRTAYEGMRALWASPLGASVTVAIAEPIAYIPEHRLLVQGPLAEEQTLYAQIETMLQTQSATEVEQLNDYLHKTALGLAELHSSGVTVGAIHQWEDELAQVRAFVAPLTTAIPALAPAVMSLFTYIEGLAVGSTPDGRVPTHGTFRPAQVLLDHGRIGFIDFDSFCQAEPAMDLALFMVALVDFGMTTLHAAHPSIPDEGGHHMIEEQLAQLDAIAETFLGYYTAVRSVSRQRLALWKALNTLELVARSWDRVKPARLNHTVMMLERQLRSYGGEGTALVR